MTPEIAMYILGAMTLPAVGWAITAQFQLLNVRADLKTLVEMHKNPDNTGFGTRPLITLVTDNTRALNGMTAAVTEQTAWFKGHYEGANRS